MGMGMGSGMCKVNFNGYGYGNDSTWSVPYPLMPLGTSVLNLNFVDDIFFLYK